MLSDLVVSASSGDKKSISHTLKVPHLTLWTLYLVIIYCHASSDYSLSPASLFSSL